MAIGGTFSGEPLSERNTVVWAIIFSIRRPHNIAPVWKLILQCFDIFAMNMVIESG